MRSRFKPVVSVIVPVGNSKRTIRDTLDSIRRQTFKKLEVIAVDDATTDGTRAILKSYAKRYAHVRIVKLERSIGANAAFNYGVPFAKGMYIARLNAGDRMTKTRIAKQLEFLETHGLYAAVGGQIRIVNRSGKTIGTDAFPTTHADIAYQLFHFIPISSTALLVNRRKLPRSFRYYVQTVSHIEEFDLYYRLLQFGRLANLPETVALTGEPFGRNRPPQELADLMLLWTARIHAITKLGYIPGFTNTIQAMVHTVLFLLYPDRAIRKVKNEAMRLRPA